MNLPAPAPSYSVPDQQNVRGVIAKADGQNVKQGGDYEVANGRIILKSPDGTRWILGVNNAGATTWAAA